MQLQGSFHNIESTGLGTEGLELKSLLFINRDTGFALGSIDNVWTNPDKNNDTFAFGESNAAIFRTTNGGRTWSKKNFGKGYFTQIIKIDKLLLAFKTSDNYTRISVFLSDNMGDTWKEQTSFPSDIRNILGDNNTLYAIVRDSIGNKSKLFISEDQGEHWDVSHYLKYPIFHTPIIYQHKILYLSNSDRNTYFPNLLIEYNIENHSSTIIEMPEEFECYFLTNWANEVNLCGRSNGKIVTYSFINNKLEFNYIVKETDSLDFPEYFYNTKKRNIIIAGHRRSFNLEYRVLISSDQGKNWKTINLIKDNYIKPYYFFNDGNTNTAYFYSGHGMFQVLNYPIPN
jgi:hypothetical protein